MLRTFLYLAFAMMMASSASAEDVLGEEGTTATVLKLNKDRGGKRHANRWVIECTAAGQVWTTGKLPNKMRKMFIRAGLSDLKIARAAPPGSIGDILNGSAGDGWHNLKAKKAHDYGNPQRLTVICIQPSTFKAHAEWYK